MNYRRQALFSFSKWKRTNNQAFTSGIAAGFAEVLFEKFSVDNLLKGVGDSTFFKSLLKRRKWEKAVHISNKDAKYGIYKYDSKFAFPSFDPAGIMTAVNAFDCKLVILNASAGNKYLYDVIGTKEDTVTATALMKRERSKGMKESQPKGVFARNCNTG